MKALILSCGFGGGHNSAAVAIKEELIDRGHSVVLLDPYTLVNEKLSEELGSLYSTLLRKSPHVNGFFFSVGKIARKVPGPSPTYYINVSVAKKLEKYLRLNEFDIIIMTHIYPAELITYLKKHQVALPTTLYVSTDYLCIPFTEDTECDYYVVPSEKVAKSYIRNGIPKEKLLPLGVPVRKTFEEPMDKKELRKQLGLEDDKYYALVAGGSLGIGKVRLCVKECIRSFRRRKVDGMVVVACGSNERLYRHLKVWYGDRIILLENTKFMAEYMKACDLFITKPGGMSATEAAVVGIPCIITTPVPGCEKYNMKYFRKTGMALGTGLVRLELPLALKVIERPEITEKMNYDRQEKLVHHSRKKICDWIEGN